MGPQIVEAIKALDGRVKGKGVQNERVDAVNEDRKVCEDVIGGDQMIAPTVKGPMVTAAKMTGPTMNATMDMAKMNAVNAPNVNEKKPPPPPVDDSDDSDDSDDMP